MHHVRRKAESHASLSKKSSAHIREQATCISKAVDRRDRICIPSATILRQKRPDPVPGLVSINYDRAELQFFTN